MVDKPGDSLAELMSHEARVRLFFLRHADEYEADDLTQDTILAAWRSLHRFRGDSSLSTWLHGIAKRLLWNHYRLKSSQPLVLEACYELELEGAPTEPDRISGFALEMALDELPCVDRQLYESFYRQRICIRQIAKELGEPEGTVKYRLFRLREALRRQLV